MGKRYITIRPLDTFLFKEGYSLNKGTTNWITSRKMPHPSVLYGTICSALMRQGKLTEVKNAIENNSPNLEEILKRNLKIKKIYILHQGEFYIPAPADLFCNRRGEIYYAEEIDGILSPPCYGKESMEQLKGHFIKLEDFCELYTEGEAIPYSSIISEADIWGVYNKTGLELQPGKTAREGHLYTIQMVAFKDQNSCYIIECEYEDEEEKESDQDKEEIVLTGGKTKTAVMGQLEKNLQYKLNNFVSSYESKVYNKLNWIYMYFLTPASTQHLENLLTQDRKCAVITSGIELVGGYDIKDKKMKRLERCISAGTVVKFKEEKWDGIDYKTIADKVTNLINEPNHFRGFGSFLLF